MGNTDRLISSVDAVVLAGGVNSEAMREATGVENRALVELTPGRTMLDYVISAAKSAHLVSKIVVVGDVPDSSDYTRLESTPTFLENLIRGVESLAASSDKVLIVTSDIPFITPGAIDDFLNIALKADSDLCYPIIPMDIYRQKFGVMKRTTLKLKEGEFTGGNIMLMSASYIKNHQQTILQAYAARKDVLKLGAMLGWGLLLRVLLSQTISRNMLDIPTLEQGISRLLGHNAKASAIITNHPSLGTDVDKPDDVVEARRILLSVK